MLITARTKRVKGALSQKFCCVLVKTAQFFFTKDLHSNMKILLECPEENIE